MVLMRCLGFELFSEFVKVLGDFEGLFVGCFKDFGGVMGLFGQSFCRCWVFVSGFYEVFGGADGFCGTDVFNCYCSCDYWFASVWNSLQVLRYYCRCLQVFGRVFRK